MENLVRSSYSKNGYEPSQYLKIFDTPLESVEHRLIGARMTSNVEGQDPLDELMQRIDRR